MTLGKSKIFLIFCLTFIAGVFIGRYINYEIMAIAAMIFIIFTTVGWKSKIVRVIGVSGLILLIGGVRFRQNFYQNDLSQFYGQKVQASGTISEEPDVRPDKTYLTLSRVVVNDRPISSKLLLTVSQYSEYEYGQRLNFESKISEPKEYPDFSYKNYLSRFGIDGLAYYPKVEVVPGNFGNPIKLQILRFKKKFVEKISQVLPEPHNSFLAGLLLGAKRTIPQNLLDQFNRTGTSHIVAVSGYNITIIVAGIEGLLTWFGLRKRLSFGFSLLAIVGFVIMTGASASVIRAGIMGSLILLALNVGRLNTAGPSLAVTAVIMLAINPQILAFDIGFQLSFLALLGIVYLTPMLEPFFLWVPQFLRQYLLATLAAQIFTLAILLYNFGSFSVVAPLVNMLVLVAVPPTMLFGFVTGVAALIWIKLAWPVARITQLLLAYILKVIGFFSNLSFAAISWHLNVSAVVIYYFILLLILLMYYYKDEILQGFTKIKFWDKLRSQRSINNELQ